MKDHEFHCTKVATLISIYLCPSQNKIHSSHLHKSKCKFLHPGPPHPSIAIGTSMFKCTKFKCRMHKIQHIWSKSTIQSIQTTNFKKNLQKILWENLINPIGPKSLQKFHNTRSQLRRSLHSLQNPTTQGTISKSQTY